eukprot:XP_001699784.1 predicted protein [Chlamydomonas reinhardtii]
MCAPTAQVSGSATTPTEVAERIIAFVEAGGGASGPGGGRRAAAAAGAPHVGWFAPGGWRPEQIRKEAEESTHRLREGRARSLLEGVPFAVKDAADALPYPTTCGTTFDVALMYAAMCGAAQWADAGLPPRSPGLLPEEPLPVLLPSPWPRLQPQAGAGAAGGGQKGPLAGLRIGVYDKWFDDAAPTVVAACRAALAAAERCGAQVVAVCVPDLEPLRVAHTVTIVSEMAQNFRERATNPRLRSAFNPESRLALANSRFWNSADYIQVHVLATPTTPIPSPRIHPAALTGGPSSGAVMLPAGLQLMGRPQEEATLLRVGAVLEAELAKAGVTAGAAPPVHINPLTGERRGL